MLCHTFSHVIRWLCVQGGCLYASGAATVTAHNSVFANNQASLGGAVAVTGASTSFTCVGCRGEHNVAAGSGGFAYASDGGQAQFVEGWLVNNTAALGGTVAVVSATLSIDQTQIIGSISTADGGSIHASGASTLTLARAGLQSSHAGGSGGAVFARGVRTACLCVCALSHACIAALTDFLLL